MSFSIADTRLGKKLERIKENYPFYFYTPFVCSQNTLLDSNTVASVLSSGILCDITSNSVTVTFPPATVLQNLLNMEVGNYVPFFFVAYSSTFPNANTLNIVGNTNVEPLGILIAAQETYYVYLICISVNPVKFYII